MSSLQPIFQIDFLVPENPKILRKKVQGLLNLCKSCVQIITRLLRYSIPKFFMVKLLMSAFGNNSGFLSLSRKKSKVKEIAKHNPIRNWCYMTRFLTNFQNVDVGGSWCGIAERAEGTGGAAARWREIEHIQIWVRRNFSHVLTWSIKALGLLVAS